MKYSVIAALLCLATFPSFAKSGYVKTLKASFNEVDNDYQFFLRIGFNIDYNMDRASVIFEKSNDTVFIKEILDVRGKFTLGGGEQKDTIDYKNTFADVSYFNISINTVDYYIDPETGYADESRIDTSWNELNITINPAATSITELDYSKNSFNLFPNPGKDFIHFKTTFPTNELIVLDLSGQEVLHLATPTKEIDVRTLPNGIYQILAFDKHKILVGKAKFWKQ